MWVPFTAATMKFIGACVGGPSWHHRSTGNAEKLQWIETQTIDQRGFFGMVRFLFGSEKCLDW